MRFSSRALFILCVLVHGVGAHAQSAESERPGLEDRAAAYHAFMLGRSLEGVDDLDGAVAAYTQATQLDPNASGIWAELAALYARRNQPEEAIVAGNAALDRDPNDTDAHRILGLVYAARAGSQVGQDSQVEADVELAVQHLERARNPVLPDAGLYLTLGRLYVATGQTENAIEVLTEVLETEPQFTEALAMLAAAHEARSEWSAAVAAYERAVLLNPRRARYRRRLASALVNAGRRDRALEVLRELVVVRRDDGGAWFQLAELELESDNYDAAETAARRVVELEPEGLRGPFMLSRVLGATRQYRAMVDTLRPLVDSVRDDGSAPAQLANLLQRLSAGYHSLGDLNQAVDALTEAASLVPSNVALQAQLAQVYLDAGRLDEAAGIVARARTARPESLALLRLQAQTLLARGEVGDAMSLLEDARIQHADRPIAHVALASVYIDNDRGDDAVRVLTEAEQRFPDSRLITFQLGAVFERVRRYTEAEQAFRRVLDRNPDDAPTLNYLGYMLAELGERLDESVMLIQRALELDPKNGSYLDSLGWAYFMQDQLELAESPLREASDQLQRNSVVQDHMGDLLFRLERYREAISAWERALAGDGDGLDLSTVEAKISDARTRLEP